jgi:signal transduction histidine kinase
MTSINDRPNGINHLAVSIRLQKVLRNKQILRSKQRARQVRELEADKNFLLEMRKITREKMARELHDGLTQTVATLAMRVNYSRRLMDTDQKAAVEELHKVEDLTRLTAKEIRYMIFTLRPVELESTGLGPALELMADKVGELFDLKIHLSLDQDLLNRVKPNKQRLLYLLIEEAIDFMRRKGEIEELWLRLACDKGDVALLEIESGEGSMIQSKMLEDNRELDELREHAKLVGGVVKIKAGGENGGVIQVLLPLTEISSEK